MEDVKKILLCFQDNTTVQQPRAIWDPSSAHSPALKKFKMAAFTQVTRGNFPRFLQSCLSRKGYCVAAEIQPYVYHPKSRILEPENQALYLTKTLQMGGVSKCLPDTVIDRKVRKEMMAKFRQNVIQTRLVNFEGEHATRNMCALPLMQNMLRVVWSYSSR